MSGLLTAVFPPYEHDIFHPHPLLFTDHNHREASTMMPMPEACSNDVAYAIPLAPVFLLTGIAGMLNVMTGRLSRIIDRGRRLLEASQGNEMMEESYVLFRRCQL